MTHLIERPFASRPVLIEHLRQDTRFAIRQLRKSPAFACTAMLVLALGMAASVSIFAFVDAALLKPLPYADPSRLLLVYVTGLHRPGGYGFVSYEEYHDWRDMNRTFRSIDAFDVRMGSFLTTSTGMQRIPTLTVTAGFFRTLGVAPLLGRDFRADEEGPSAPATTMLSYGAWQTRFGGRPDVVGESVILDGEPHLVIGVLPQGFHFTLANQADFWITPRGGNYCRSQRGCRSMQAIARLRDGVTPPAASADMASVAARLATQYPQLNADVTADVARLQDVMLGDVRPILLVLLSGAGLLLVIACVNVASLLLVRSDGRTREIAVRGALGASAGRLALQFATEALVLVGGGGFVGLMLAAWSMRFLTSLLSTNMLDHMPYLRGIGLSAHVIAFAAAVALFAAVLFAATPMLRASMSDRFTGLKEGGRGSAGRTWRRFAAHLVIVELVLAVVLLVGAGLLTKSARLLLRVDTGLNPDHLATLSVSPRPDPSNRSDAIPPPEIGIALARQVAERVAAAPGVLSVGYADQLPLSPGNGAPASNLQVPGRPFPDKSRKSAPVRRVSAGYFATLQARMLRGREFTEAEVASSRRVVIINRTAAEQYFPGEDPVGRAIIVGAPPARQIVGVVADLKDTSIEVPAWPASYIPFDQPSFSLVVRTSQGTDAQFPSLIAAIREVRPDLVISRGNMMTDHIDQLPSVYLHRSSAWLVSAFATVAFLLGVVGLYGVVAYSVSQRNREIGVRMALGAHSGNVYRLVLGEASRLTFLGIAIGLVCAVAAASLIRALLFSVQAWDVPTLTVVASTLATSALLASYIPARRAASVNPVEALRAE